MGVDCFPHLSSEQIVTFMSAFLPHAWHTQQHHWWSVCQQEFSPNHINKSDSQQRRSSESYDRWLILTHSCRSHRSCSTRSHHHIFRKLMTNLLCNFVVFIAIVRVIKHQNIVVNRNHWTLVSRLNSRPLCFQRFHVLSCTHQTDVDAGHAQT